MEKTKDELIENYEDLIRTLEEKITGMETHIWKLQRNEKVHTSTIKILEKQVSELKKPRKMDRFVMFNDY